MTNDFLSDPWFERYQARVNHDPEMAAIGDWFTTTFSVAADDQRHVLQVGCGSCLAIGPRHASTVGRCLGFVRRWRLGINF